MVEEEFLPREEAGFDEDLQQYVPEPTQPYDASFWNYNLLLTMLEQFRRSCHRFVDSAPFHVETKENLRFVVDSMFSMDSLLTHTMNLEINEILAEITNTDMRNSILAVDAEKKEFHHFMSKIDYFFKYAILPRTYGDSRERNQQGRQIVGVEKRPYKGDSMYSEKKES